MKMFVTTFIAFVFFANNVLAGSRTWQPQINPLERRYFYVNVNDGTDDKTVWPRRKIRYCYESKATEDELKVDLNQAFQIWRDRGLDHTFSFKKVNDEICANERTEVLYIQFSGENGPISTFVGFAGIKNRIRLLGEGRMNMILSNSTTKGMLNTVANYAHEIGHAWGLFHEHQNPAFWKGVNGLGVGLVFGPDNNNWNCENLEDYDSKNAELEAKGSLETMENLCSSHGKASDENFSAFDYLPIGDSRGIAHSAGGNTEDVDWNSIMIYPSGAGGRIDPTSTAEDKRLPILLKDDGSRIPINVNPSGDDIRGLLALYGREKATADRVLLQKANGVIASSFGKVFSSSKGQGSSSCL